MSADASPGAVSEATEERWLVDEMLGRFARFLRILGYDTEYVQGLADDAIHERAREEGRTLLTRDGALAARTPHAIVLISTDLRGQLLELWTHRPTLGRTPRFTRCTICNGPLRPLEGDRAKAVGVPEHIRETAAPGSLYRCERCGQPYWEGSHTEKIRAFLQEVAGSIPG
jgi:uncharacterized protein with PIN domain